MDNKIRRQDAEAVLANPAFQIAMDQYLAKAQVAVISAATPDEAYRAAIGMQKGADFLAAFKDIISADMVDQHNEAMKQKYNESKVIEFKR